MKMQEKEKYLGDIIHSNGQQHETIVEILAERYGILANIKALLDYVPLSHRRTQIGPELRDGHGLLMECCITVKYDNSLQTRTNQT